MESVGIRELKNHLSRYLREVRSGHEVVVTERGKAVAKIVPVFLDQGSEAEALLDLAKQGLIHMPEAAMPSELPDPVRIKGNALAATVLEGRR